MTSSSTLILPTAYLPSLHYMALVVKAGEIQFDYHEYYIRQSIRNRCQILTANGPLNLSIPLVHVHGKESCAEKKICYKENWSVKHWRAITSAYKNSPFFDFFEDEFEALFSEKREYLWEWNEQFIRLFLRFWRLRIPINHAETYTENICQLPDGKASDMHFPPYYQVFQDKFPFQSNLSILDLLFNEGKFSLDYLKNLNI